MTRPIWFTLHVFLVLAPPAAAWLSTLVDHPNAEGWAMAVWWLSFPAWLGVAAGLAIEDRPILAAMLTLGVFAGFCMGYGMFFMPAGLAWVANTLALIVMAVDRVRR